MLKGGLATWPLKLKLSLLTFLTTVTALTIVSLALITIELYNGWGQMVRQVALTAETVGRDSRSSILFEDHTFAANTLSGLAIQEEIRAAGLFKPDGTVFVDYYRDEADRFQPLLFLDQPGHFYAEGELVLVHQVELDGEPLAYLVIRAGLEGFRTRLLWFVLIVTFVVVLSLLAVYPIWAHLQHAVTDPIRILLDAIHRIARDNNYGVRVAHHYRDELGELITGFNRMLGQIEERDLALAEHQRKLEDEVQRRTQELLEANQALELEIIERRNAEAELARFKETLDRTLDSVYMFAPGEARIAYCNRGAELLSGYPGERLSRMPFRALLGEFSDRQYADLEQRLMARPPHSETFQTGLLQQSGATLPVDIFLQYVQTAAGAGRFVALVRDMSQHKRLEQAMLRAKEQAEAASLAKSQFLANMSHEIRTPMNAIVGFSELALGNESRANLEEYLGNIQTAARSLLGIIDDILDFSKIEADKLNLEKVPLGLSKLLEEVCQLQGERACAKGIELLLYVAPDVPTQIVGDPLRLSQVLTNLLGNAIKFTEQGSVLLRVTCDAGDGGGPGNLLFQVADTGIGLSPHQLEHLFMPFQQADVSMTRKFGGTGLGLAICKRLVELMGGSIGVRANAGDGSLFHFSLPLSHACPQWPLEPGERPLRGVRMLVIDDAAVGREVLAGLLRDLGAEGEAWPDLSRVTEQSRDIDLLVLDNGLLDAGSAQVLAGLAKHRGQQWPGLVLVTSLREREKLLRETAGIPYRALLARPFSGTALLDACEVALGRKGTDAPSQPQQVPVDRSRELLEGAEILLVDDIRTNQMVARAILARHGMRVTLCGNGQEALERIGERPFAAVLMDIQMPVMDGYQATRAIRADSAYDAIPIIAMTAHAMIGDREKCLQSGMDDYISKPVNAARLIELLAKWVARRDGGAPRMADGA